MKSCAWCMSSGVILGLQYALIIEFCIASSICKNDELPCALCV
ncbi:hypothetical protein OIU84_002796 [Salix udensis]|uniref:Uncharacterized protein n=1 Tax=Salix udensis TaxID=889485 RepID=A0AAD6K500_9ROSI|nr:hypothetical protein OIU84_002796 [Salix udensis]